MLNNSGNENSRAKRVRKRKKNNLITFLILGVGSVTILIFISFIFGAGANKDMSEEAKKENLQTEEIRIEEDENKEEINDQEENEGFKEIERDEPTENIDDETEQPEEETDEIQSVETNDENVIEAYTSNWQPIQTEQSGEHTLNFNKNSQDRNEMEAAASLATELDQEQMTTWWLENKGDGQIEATVSDRKETEIYRVQLQWIDGEGWQPLQVSVLKENDQKWRFQ